MANLSALRVPILFKSNVETENDEGGLENTYQTELETVAAVRQISQVRAIEAGIDATFEANEVEVRNMDLDSLNKDWLVEYDGKTHTIHSINPYGLNRKQWITLITKVKI